MDMERVDSVAQDVRPSSSPLQRTRASRLTSEYGSLKKNWRKNAGAHEPANSNHDRLNEMNMREFTSLIFFSSFFQSVQHRHALLVCVWSTRHFSRTISSR